MLVSEFDAMVAYQRTPDEWFALDRGWRAMMIAHQRITRIMNAIQEHDLHEEAKRKGKRGGRN